VRTIDWGFATISSSYIRHYFTKTCVTCASYADGFDNTRSAHYRYIGGRLTVTGTSQDQRNFSLVTPVTTSVLFNSTAGEAVDKKGRFVNGEPAHTQEVFHVQTVWRGSAWAVVDLKLTPT
jgi:hypothetical protein